MHVLRVTTVEGETRQHAASPLGSDYALCGLTLDDDPTVIRKIEERDGAVTCEQCLTVIRFCKTVKL